MNTIDVSCLDTGIGELIIGSIGDRLCLLDFRLRRTVDARLQRLLNARFVQGGNELHTETARQVKEYLQRERKHFDLPYCLVGSDFQCRVWQALDGIPYGSTSTYADLARKTGRESAVCAVASANGANALALIVPCHRIIGSKGDLVGYGGGLPVKQRLLALESPDLLTALS